MINDSIRLQTADAVRACLEASSPKLEETFLSAWSVERELFPDSEHQ